MNKWTKPRNNSHAEIRRRRKGIRPKGDLWSYNGDGQFSNEKMTPADKRYWRRWNRRQKNDTTNPEID